MKVRATVTFDISADGARQVDEVLGHIINGLQSVYFAPFYMQGMSNVVIRKRSTEVIDDPAA